MPKKILIKNSISGSLLVAMASILWATDALFRVPALYSLNPVIIVLFEHIICLLALLPWVLVFPKTKIFKLSTTGWGAAILIGAGGSALATVLFTSSFKYTNPSVSILLQKLQPILTVFFASLFLGERPGIKFFKWAPVALASGLLLSFPDLNFNFFDNGFSAHHKGVFFAVLAALLWSLSTIAGKALLKNQPSSITTFWRFFFGFITLLIMWITSGDSLPLDIIKNDKIIIALLYMGLISGLLAMLAYYAGLKKIQASISTFVELMFPITAVILNTVLLDMPLTKTQIIAACVLLLAVTQISRSGVRAKK